MDTAGREGEEEAKKLTVDCHGACSVQSFVTVSLDMMTAAAAALQMGLSRGGGGDSGSCGICRGKEKVAEVPAGCRGEENMTEASEGLSREKNVHG